MIGATTTTTSGGNAPTPSTGTTSPPVEVPVLAVPTIPEEREVASGIVNLGNTCYANAVLQALAHSPDLCLAMEGEPHSTTCPIRAANARKAMEREREEREKQNGGGEESKKEEKKEEPDATAAPAPAATGNGRGRRGKRGQSKGGKSEDNGNGAGGGGSGNGGSVLDDDEEFCVLCEVEGIVSNVHRAGLAAATAATTANTGAATTPAAADPNSSSSAEALGPVAPNRFVAGFTSRVAPWFRRGRQEDSHEFLRLLIDGMQKSCIRSKELRGTGADADGESGTDGEGEKGVDGGETDRAGGGVDAEKKSKRPDPQCRAGADDDAAPTAVLANGDDGATTTDNCSKKEEEKQKGDKEEEEEDVERRYPFQLFRGTVESVVTCSACKGTNRTVDPMEDVGLECVSGSVGRSGRPERTVALALERFVAPERLDCYKCEACGTVGGATKQSRLASVPPVLTLHLKRFRYGQAQGAGGVVGVGNGGTGGNGSFGVTTGTSSSATSSLSGGGGAYGKSGSNKIEGHVKFAELFDVRPYLTDEGCAELSSHRNVLCRLFAVVVHTGANSHSGHYYAYVRNLTRGEWWKMDDATVQRASIRQVCDAHAYMLFYTVVKHPVATRLRDCVNERREAAAAAKAAAEEAAKAKAAAAEAEEAAAKKKTEEEEGTTADVKSVQPPIADPSSSSNAAPAAVNGDADDAAERGGTSSSFASESTGDGKSRKRGRPAYSNGEEWARKRTRLPPSLAAATAVAESWVSERVEFRAEYFRRLQASVLAANVSVERGGVTTIDSAAVEEAVLGGVDADGDVLGGCGRLRRFLRHMVRRMMTSGDRNDCFWLPGDLREEGGDDEDDDSSSPPSSRADDVPSSSATLSASASTKFVVPVVEANDTLV